MIYLTIYHSDSQMLDTESTILTITDIDYQSQVHTYSNIMAICAFLFLLLGFFVFIGFLATW